MSEQLEHGLMTGFPGFIGRRLARKLLEGSDDARLTVLVEERMRARGAGAGRSLG